MAARDAVLLADAVRERGLHARVARDQRCPPRRVALEILDRRAQRRLATQRERLDEVKLALLGLRPRLEPRHRLARLRGEAPGPALDEKQERVRALCRQPGKQ